MKPASKSTMFLFLCVSADEHEAILRDGLSVTAEVRARFSENLKDVEAACRDLILVARRDVVDGLSSGGAGALLRLGESAFVNASPYRPPRRIDAGGGYVARPGAGEPELLLIHRRGHWDLPKGKRDPGESLEDCALREVREELGISRLHLVAPLGTTLHGYSERDRYRVKTTHWYLMQTPETRFTPQRDEDIDRVEWLPYGEAMRTVGYRSLREHMHRARPLVFEHLNV